MGNTNIALNGYMLPTGIMTKNDVKNMQKSLGVSADGIWGPKTQAAYDVYLVRKGEEAKYSYPSLRPPIGVTTNEGVSALQSKLSVYPTGRWDQASQDMLDQTLVRQLPYNKSKLADVNKLTPDEEYKYDMLGYEYGIGRGSLDYAISGYDVPEWLDNKFKVARYQNLIGVMADGLWGPRTDAAHQKLLAKIGQATGNGSTTDYSLQGNAAPVNISNKSKTQLPSSAASGNTNASKQISQTQVPMPKAVNNVTTLIPYDGRTISDRLIEKLENQYRKLEEQQKSLNEVPLLDKFRVLQSQQSKRAEELNKNIAKIQWEIFKLKDEGITYGGLDERRIAIQDPHAPGGSDTIPFLGASEDLRLHTLLDDHGLLDGRNKGRPEKDIYWENFNPGILGSVTQSGTENFLGYQYYAPFREAEQVFLNNLGMLPTMAQAAAIAGINQAAYNKALTQENMAWERMNAEYNMAQAELARSSAAGSVGKYSDSQIKNILNELESGGFKNNPLRQAYEKEVTDLPKMKDSLLQQGMSQEEIARTLNQARRDLGIKYKDATLKPLRDFIYERNQIKYGDPLGPTFEKLVANGKTFEQIIESASRPNADINNLLYDFEEWLRGK